MDPLQKDKELSRGMDSSASGPGQPSRWPWVLGMILVLGALALLYVYWGRDLPETKPETPQSAQETPGKSSPGKTGQAGQTGQAGEVPPPPQRQEGGVVAVAPHGQQAEGDAALQAQRKEPYGLDKSLDAVVRSDESIKVGDQVVKVGDLERKMVVEQRGEMLDKPLGPEAERRVSAWGVHMVRPGENLWDIHLRLLSEYMASRGVELAPGSDKPTPQGFSSGVGKILKFAEHMVGVYNVKTHTMSSNLDLLEPGSKLVVFNLSEIFKQLAKIDPKDLSGVMYDGRVLLFPKASSPGN